MDEAPPFSHIGPEEKIIVAICLALGWALFIILLFLSSQIYHEKGIITLL